VIVADDENRENEGGLVGAAEQVTPEMINFMATQARVDLPDPPARALSGLGLTQMAEGKHRAHETAFTVSIEPPLASVSPRAFPRGPRGHDPRWRSIRPACRPTCDAPAT